MPITVKMGKGEEFLIFMGHLISITLKKKRRKETFLIKRNKVRANVGRRSKGISASEIHYPWSNLPRELKTFPLLEIFKTRLDKTLGSVQWRTIHNQQGKGLNSLNKPLTQSLWFQCQDFTCPSARSPPCSCHNGRLWNHCKCQQLTILIEFDNVMVLHFYSS